MSTWHQRPGLCTQAKSLLQTRGSRKQLPDSERCIYLIVSRERWREEAVLKYRLAGWCLFSSLLSHLWILWISRAMRYSLTIDQYWSIVTFINCVTNKGGIFISAREAKCPLNHKTNKPTKTMNESLWCEQALLWGISKIGAPSLNLTSKQFSFHWALAMWWYFTDTLWRFFYLIFSRCLDWLRIRNTFMTLQRLWKHLHLLYLNRWWCHPFTPIMLSNICNVTYIINLRVTWDSRYTHSFPRKLVHNLSPGPSSSIYRM